MENEAESGPTSFTGVDRLFASPADGSGRMTCSLAPPFSVTVHTARPSPQGSSVSRTISSPRATRALMESRSSPKVIAVPASRFSNRYRTWMALLVLNSSRSPE